MENPEESLHGKQATNPRRGIIREVLEAHGYISLADLQNRCKAENYGSVSRQMFHDDMAALEVILDWKFEPTRDEKGGLAYRLKSAHHPMNKRQRENLNVARKTIIAELLKTVVLTDQEELLYAARGQESVGKKKKSPPAERGDEAEKLSIETVLDKRLYHPSYSVGRTIDEKLRAWWRANMRKLAIDAGSTLETFVAKHLRQLRLPSQNGSLCALSVCTNNASVIKELARPSEIQLIVVGGAYHVPTGSNVGGLAEKFIQASGISFGMVLLGASCLDLDTMGLGADSELDAAIKLEYMKACSGMKVVVIDETKFTEGSAGHYFYAAVNPFTIDLILTDQISQFYLSKILSAGVPVLANKVL